jgi:murein DD-endopeptidase MepM/ murein hydrolase activator NlpD
MRIAFALLGLLPAAASAGEGARPRVSSGFGARVDPIDGHAGVHRGLDMPGRLGTEVVAAAAGVVRVAGRRGSYGNFVEIAHADGSATRYAHLSIIHVRAGEPVAQGQMIARMGSTGRSTGSHLHFEYRIGGVAVDPTPYLARASALPRYRGRARATAAEAPYRSRFALARDAASGAPDLTRAPGR